LENLPPESSSAVPEIAAAVAILPNLLCMPLVEVPLNEPAGREPKNLYFCNLSFNNLTIKFY
jgi:hypothetical protein